MLKFSEELIDKLSRETANSLGIPVKIYKQLETCEIWQLSKFPNGLTNIRQANNYGFEHEEEYTIIPGLPLTRDFNRS